MNLQSVQTMLVTLAAEVEELIAREASAVQGSIKNLLSVCDPTSSQGPFKGKVGEAIGPLKAKCPPEFDASVGLKGDVGRRDCRPAYETGATLSCDPSALAAASGSKVAGVSATALKGVLDKAAGLPGGDPATLMQGVLDKVASEYRAWPPHGGGHGPHDFPPHGGGQGGGGQGGHGDEVGPLVSKAISMGITAQQVVTALIAGGVQGLAALIAHAATPPVVPPAPTPTPAPAPAS